MRKYIWPILTGIICIIIFVFSQQSGEASTGISDKFVNPLDNIFLNLFSRDFLILLVRKGAHISIYFLLGIFAYLTFKRIGYAIIFCFLYACSDEIHQLFIPGRSGSFFDVLIDGVGFVVGCVICYIFYKKHCKNNNNLI